MHANNKGLQVGIRVMVTEQMDREIELATIVEGCNKSQVVRNALAAYLEGESDDLLREADCD